MKSSMNSPRLVQISKSSLAEKNYGKNTIIVVLLIIGKIFFFSIIDFPKPNFCIFRNKFVSTIERNLEHAMQLG